MHQKIKCFYLFLFLINSQFAEASHGCSQWLAKIISFQGKVEIQFKDENQWHSVSQNETFCRGDKIRAGKKSRATLIFSNNSLATLDQNTTLIFLTHEKKRYSWFLKLLEGSTFFRSRHSQRLNVQTPFINAVHEGTEFLVEVTSKQTKIAVFDGRVRASNPMGELDINKGFIGIASKNRPPHLSALTLRLTDAVQWTLYYPPIIDYQVYKHTADTLITSAIGAYQQGDIHQALEILDQTPANQQNSELLTLKSSLLLSVGRVDEALSNIEKIQALNRHDSTSFALLAIIEMSKNRPDNALNFARQAVKNNPGSSTARIALSYVLQSRLNIIAAIEATREAVHLSPDNALGWARLSELLLSAGEHDEALKSAKKAQQINPGLNRTLTVLGFAYLAQVDIKKAQNIFEQAIKLNSADPLAHLGLALTKIRQGDIQTGSRDLEIAVSLDPDSAVFRSYLGKAYYELRDMEYAETELALGKEMDPNDPTPWFYDAILKQVTNRPVEALHDMQKAIELNDNRGIYRSSLLLDEDSAARSANMARIYQDLSFDRIALKQAWSSLSQDFTNPSAHRFLSDTLQGKPRLRIARASELLQAQLFQPINTIPVQPQLTSENIGILNSTGPGSLSANEYDPLFTANGAHILLNGAVGSNDTLTDSAIVTGVFDQFSMSMGQFHFQSGGFRKNDDYKQNIYNLFLQSAVTPDLNIQLELKSEDVTAGDTPLRSNGVHDEDLRQSIDQNTARLGLRYSIDTKQDFIISAFMTEFKEVEIDRASKSTVTRFPFPLPTIITNESNQDTVVFDETGYQLETQYLFHPRSFNLIAGFGYLNLEAKRFKQRTKAITEQLIPVFGASSSTFKPSTSSSTQYLETHYFNGYLYSNTEIVKGLKSTLGLSYDLYDDGLTDISQFNPKVGILWNPVEELTVRAAVYRTLKRPLAGSQTIEPTQLAGFNQFFDENDGTTAWQYGWGFDYQPLDTVFLGGKLLWRDTKQPIVTLENIAFPQKRNESAHLAYAYWAPTEWTALRSEYRFDEFRKDYSITQADNKNPRSVTRHQVLLSLNLYHPTGVFSKFTGTYVNQNSEFVNTTNRLDRVGDRFWVFDSTLGFRFPKKYGSISLEVRNIFNNQSFIYQSEFNTSGPQLTSFVPEREFFLKLNLSY